MAQEPVIEEVIQEQPVETTVLVDIPVESTPEPIVEEAPQPDSESKQADLDASRFIRTRKGRIIELPKQEPPAFMLVKLKKVTNINYTY